MLTNYKTIRGSIKKLKDLEIQEQDGTLIASLKKRLDADSLKAEAAAQYWWYQGHGWPA
jgi:ribosomal protein S2